MTAAPPKPRKRDVAWSYLVANLAVCPGAGSMMAGRRWVGLSQGALALAGLGLSLWFMYGIVREWTVRRQFVLPEGRLLMVGVGGVGCFLAAWVWALATSLALLRAAEREEGKPGSGPGGGA